jgi:hypothetical protein
MSITYHGIECIHLDLGFQLIFRKKKSPWTPDRNCNDNVIIATSQILAHMYTILKCTAYLFMVLIIHVVLKYLIVPFLLYTQWCHSCSINCTDTWMTLMLCYWIFNSDTSNQSKSNVAWYFRIHSIYAFHLPALLCIFLCLYLLI